MKLVMEQVASASDTWQCNWNDDLYSGDFYYYC
jgi:hypothetical protein